MCMVWLLSELPLWIWRYSEASVYDMCVCDGAWVYYTCIYVYMYIEKERRVTCYTLIHQTNTREHQPNISSREHNEECMHICGRKIITYKFFERERKKDRKKNALPINSARDEEGEMTRSWRNASQRSCHLMHFLCEEVKQHQQNAINWMMSSSSQSLRWKKRIKSKYIHISTMSVWVCLHHRL